MTKLSRGLRLDPREWLSDRALRSCSPAARGFWCDILCLCHGGGGYLVIPSTGAAIDDGRLARMVGEPVSRVRAWLKELGEAGIFSVDDEGRLFVPRLIRDAEFAEKARVWGKRGAAKRVRTVVPVDVREQTILTTPAAIVEEISASVPAVPVTPSKPSLPWYKSPAGWVRTAQQHAMSIGAGESLADFKLRVSLRIPPGPHLEALTAAQMRQWDAAQPKPAEEKRGA